MIKINKKEMVMSIVALLFIILVVVGITYAAFNYTGLGTKSNKVTTSTITMNYNEATNGITLSDAFPISDNDGKQLTGEGRTFSFTVTVTTGNNTAVGYEVSAVKDPTSTLGNNDVRIYLEKSSSGAEGTYSEVLAPTGYNPINATTEIGTPQGEMLLHSDSTTTTRTDYYILRMWVAEDYQVTGESKFFTIKVNVYGTDSHINTSGISLNKNSMTLDEGESEQLSATVLPEYATDKSVTWASSNTDVAVVDSNGNVTAQSISGTTATAVVTARDANGHSATCTVTVNKPEPTGVEIEDNILELNLIAPGQASGEVVEGSSTILEAGTTPANANSNEVEWTTSNSSVLDIEKYTEANASGTGSSKSVVANKVKVTAKGAGSATLTVKSASNPSAPSKSITVTIQDPESTGLSIDKPNVTIDRNSSTQVTATLNLSNSRDKTIYWTSSDSTKASISCSGGSTNSSGELVTTSATAVCTVTGLEAGTTTITARDAKGHTASSIVTVQNELASSVSLSSDVEIEVGASHIFQASVTPSDARDISSITWTSSNTSVATIPNNCVGNTVCEIEGLDEGTTNITVTIGSLSDTSQLDVVIGIPEGVTWANSSEAEIEELFEVLDTKNISLYDYGWRVGDERTVQLGSPINETVTFVIEDIAGGGNIGPDGEDNTTSGGTVYHAVVGQKNSLSTGRKMNSSATNSGGYNSSEMKTYIDGSYTTSHQNATLGRFYSLVLSSSHYQNDGGGVKTSQLTANVKYLLHSEYEVIGMNHYASNENVYCKHFMYYSTQSNRIKYLGNGSNIVVWWGRSGVSTTNNENWHFVMFSSTGSSINMGRDEYLNNSYGVAPFGVI